MNTKRRSILSVVVAVGLAALACGGPGGGGAPKSTQAPTAPVVSGGAASTSTAASGGGASTATPDGGGEATEVPSATYPAVAAQLTVPPLLTANAATAAAATGSLRQWAAAATASTQYGDLDYAATQATGAPNSTPDCSDQKTAWASSVNSGADWLELTFTATVVPVSLNIYENDAPGSIIRVDLEEDGGVTQTVYSALPLVSAQCPRIFSVPTTGVTAHVNLVKVYFDQSVIKNWDEIDAVELVGNP